MFEIYVYPSYDEMSRKAAEVVLETLQKKEVVLGLATGSSPVGLYQNLVKAYQQGQSFKHVTTVNLDEYVGIDQDHSQSYYTFMQENLFKHVDIPSSQIHIPTGVGALTQVTHDYEDLLKKHPQDLQILGVGSNGHIGFNEPGTSFDSTCHVVELKQQTIEDNARFFSSIHDVPTQAITMGIQDIMRAKKIVLLASGEKKAKAIFEMIHGAITEEVPCTILQKHPHVIVIVDEAAGKDLT